MSGLTALRAGWEAIEAEETRLLRSLTIRESIRQWLSLQIAFESQLQQTATLFESERREALVELQTRLRRLAEWQKRHGKSVSLHAGTSATAEG